MGVIRLLLALSVVIAHARMGSASASMVMTGGTASVQMFYIISGFYMAMILNRKYTGPGSSRIFYLNRILRLYPTYFAVLILTLAITGIAYLAKATPTLLFTTWEYNWHTLSVTTIVVLVLVNLSIVGQDILMFTGISPATGHFFWTKEFWAYPIQSWHFLTVPQAWTLGLELSFYLLAPFIVRRRIGVILCIAFCGLALRHYLQHVYRLVNDPWDYRFFPIELPLFLAGSLAYRFYYVLEQRKLLKKSVSAILLALVLLIILEFPRLPKTGLMKLPWEYGFFAMSLPWIFHLCRKAVVDRWVGELSYAVYICHWVVITSVESLGSEFLRNHLVLVTVILTLSLATGLHLLVEAPIDRYRQSRAKRALLQTAPPELIKAG